tara:strand:+ start:230 stop:358 length:129 start_codon:yes stop_codon:yes gene_type:complete
MPSLTNPLFLRSREADLVVSIEELEAAQERYAAMNRHVKRFG